jgi:hypothetical protein
MEVERKIKIRRINDRRINDRKINLIINLKFLKILLAFFTATGLIFSATIGWLETKHVEQNKTELQYTEIIYNNLYKLKSKDLNERMGAVSVLGSIKNHSELVPVVIYNLLDGIFIFLEKCAPDPLQNKVYDSEECLNSALLLSTFKTAFLSMGLESLKTFVEFNRFRSIHIRSAVLKASDNKKFSTFQNAYVSTELPHEIIKDFTLEIINKKAAILNGSSNEILSSLDLSKTLIWKRSV